MASVTVFENNGSKKIHPGSGRRKIPVVGKGRQVDEQSVLDISDLLDGQELRRDRLIEYLHLIQDRYKGLFARHLVALAEKMRLPMAEVFEVASFYAHFDIILDDDPAPADVTVRVCESLTCEMMGGAELFRALKAKADGRNLRVVAAPCMGMCHQAPACEVGHRQVGHAVVEDVLNLAHNRETHPLIGNYVDYDTYVSEGGYTLLRELEDQSPGDTDKGPVADFIKTVGDAGLRGLGGAGFPTGRKWSLVRSEPGPRYLCVNADEGEPGTFKDGHYLESDPHRFLEGLLIASWSIDAKQVFIYLRDEYPVARQILIKEIAILEREGLARQGHIELRRGAGAYICGEESAMIESIEGKKGLPRHRPPYVAQVGLFGRPTLVNNVETLYWIRDIVERGPNWFAEQGRHGSKGLRSYSVSGRVREPGVKLAPAGITANELIEEFCGGMAVGHEFKAYLPGGASGGILPASMADIPLDFGTLEEHGCFVGSHAVVILSDQDSMKSTALNLMRFFEDESCGQCTPCRNGTEKAVGLMQSDIWNVPLLEELATCMRDASICGLGQAAPNPLLSVIKHFPNEIR